MKEISDSAKEKEYRNWISKHIGPNHDIFSKWDMISVTNEAHRTAKDYFPDFDEAIFKRIVKSYLDVAGE